MNGRHFPTISAVTICKNSAATIERAIRSVASAAYPSLEYVVVDGGSTDGTVELIERHRDSVSTFVSEADGGISEALNRAIALSHGTYHIIVHADDELLPQALPLLGEAAAEGGQQVVCGSVLVANTQRVVRIFKPEPNKLESKMSVPHMGCLVRREAWSAVGGYDQRRRIAMDHLFMLRILRRFGLEQFRVVDAVVARYSLGGLSDRRVIEGFRELRQNLIEEGVDKYSAYWAFGVLVAKSRLARLVGKG